MTEFDVEDVNKSLKINNQIYDVMSSVGCCNMCSLRFCGETKLDVYKNLQQTVDDRKHARNIEDTGTIKLENGVKVRANNPCVACLGMLQAPTSERIIDKIVEAVSNEEYDNPSFNVAFTIPISFYLRAHALLAFLADNYPEHVKEKLPLGVVTVGVKDVWKYVFAEKVANKINKKFSNESEFRAQVDIQYEDDHSEIACLHDIYPNKFKDQKIKAKRVRHATGPTLLFSRKTVESLLELNDREHFARFYPVPPTVPTHAAVCNNVLFDQESLYVGGRYYKYMRGLPQTAWLVKDQRRVESSVHELIADKVQALTKAQGSKLISSGREDVDVRMLGTGRPFVLELLSPRHVVLSVQELQELEHAVNTEAAGKVAVSHLKVVNKSSLEILKSGEEEKTKTYCAWCVAWGVDEDRLRGLERLKELTLQQKTPVRVLHRRPIHTRSRTVHWMTVGDVRRSDIDDSVNFKLTLNTQAGTYIKEFIHGDFGRTSPCLGELLGGAMADCLALDVESIALDWPPP